MVALTNEHAGSDGDIFSHGFKLLRLGPLIGKRTWGGVIGIWPPSSVFPDIAALAAGTLLTSTGAFATGLATCESGPKSGWQPQEKLEKQLVDQNGWKIRRIKEDGGCYEVYALNEKGQRVEAYFHPRTLEAVPTKR